MASLQVNSTSTSILELSSTASTAILSQITNPAFFGYSSDSIIDGTVIYASENCPASSTYFTSSDFATCCVGVCTPFTGCVSASTLIGPSKTEACSPSSTCKTDYIVASQGATSSLAIYCGEGSNAYWYRTLPPDGVDSSNSSALNSAETSNSHSSGVPIGAGAGGVIFFLIAAGLVYWVCSGARGRGHSRSSAPYNPNADRDHRRQQRYDQQMADARDHEYQTRLREDEERWRRQEEDNRRWQQQADQDAQARRDDNYY